MNLRTEIPKTKQGNAPMGGAKAVPCVFAWIWTASGDQIMGNLAPFCGRSLSYRNDFADSSTQKGRGIPVRLLPSNVKVRKCV